MNREKWQLIRNASRHHEYWLVSKYVNRPFSNVITYFLLDTGVTPNQVSGFTLFLGSLAGLFYFTGNFIAGGIFVQLASIVDGVDGEIARVKNMSSSIGGIIDSLSDRCVEILVFTGIAYGAWRITASPLPWLFSITGLAGLWGYYYIGELTTARMKDGLEYLLKTDRKLERKLRFSPVDRALQLFLIFLLSLFGHPEIAVLIVGVTSLPFSINRFIAFLKRGDLDVSAQNSTEF